MLKKSRGAALRPSARTTARTATVLAAVATLATVAPYAAFADSPAASDGSVVNTAPPAQPEEAVTDVPADQVGVVPKDDTKPPGTGNAPAVEQCEQANVYLPKSKGKQYHQGVGPTNSNYNNTSRTAKSTFTSEVTGSVAVSVSAGLTISINAMIGKIEQKYDVNLSASLTAKLGNSISVDTPPKTTTNAKYGVYRLKNTGISYRIYTNCESSPQKTVTSYTPLKVGWYLWEN
jgi:hypothetical protein